MKKFLLGALCALVLLVGGFGGLIYFMSSDLDKHKDPAKEVADSFMNCINKEDPLLCRERFILKEHHEQFKDEVLMDWTKLLKTKLGNRSLSKPVDESWTLTTYKGTSGAETSINFSLSTIYRLDMNTGETFKVISRDGKYYVAHVHVSSKQLMK